MVHNDFLENVQRAEGLLWRIVSLVRVGDGVGVIHSPSIQHSLLDGAEEGLNVESLLISVPYCQKGLTVGVVVERGDGH